MPLITITHTIGCDALAIARRVADGLSVEIYVEKVQLDVTLVPAGYD